MWKVGLSPELDHDPYQVATRVRNTSLQDVYGLLCRWEKNEKAASDMRHGLPLMPGEEVEASVSPFPDTAPADVRTSVIFRDRAWHLVADLAGQPPRRTTRTRSHPDIHQPPVVVLAMHAKAAERR
jgi:hypothetical protein